MYINILETTVLSLLVSPIAHTQCVYTYFAEENHDYNNIHSHDIIFFKKSETAGESEQTNTQYTLFCRVMRFLCLTPSLTPHPTPQVSC